MYLTCLLDAKLDFTTLSMTVNREFALLESGVFDMRKDI